MEIRVWQGDITTLDVDAIVNAANNSLMRGGGVCGAIFRAAGPALDEACDAIGWCDSGDAVATPGFDLPARWVIHAVGPVWEGGRRPAKPTSSPRATGGWSRWRPRSVPARSRSPPSPPGIYGFPADRAAEIAVATLRGHREPEVDEVVLVAFDDETAQRYERLLATA